jgi:putative transcriptional regulator
MSSIFIIFFVDYQQLFLYTKQKKGGIEMFKYRIDILDELSKRGYTPTKLRNDKILSQATLQSIREGRGITTNTINILCLILKCQPSDIIEIIPTDEEKIRYF